MPNEMRMTVCEEKNKTQIVLLSSSAPYCFGRSSSCNYIIRHNSVAPRQFALICPNEQWQLKNEQTKGTFLNEKRLRPGEVVPLKPGDVIGLDLDKNTRGLELSYQIDYIQRVATTASHSQGQVVRETQTGEHAATLREIDLRTKKKVLVGRGEDCTVVVHNERVSKHHCQLSYEDGNFVLEDLHSTNGTYVNGTRVRRVVLGDHATINIPTQVFAFNNGILRYHARTMGISIQMTNVTKTVADRDTHKPLNITDRVSMLVEPNTFVTLVGGSGAGKSSLLTCVTGTAPCTSGKVCFDNLDTRSNRHAFDASVGYVPQKDILHENLTVEQSLMFMARLRISGDSTHADLKAAVAKAIASVDLTGKEKTMIANLSGGQKKRVSIAMELLASPRLLILDEPTSGLSPDLDRSMMELLRRLSRNNCTILMVTHNMDNINMCDRLAFLGKGGVLCYYGPPENINPYFGTEYISDVFVKLGDADEVEQYRKEYYASPEFNRVAAAYPEVLSEVEL